MLTTIGPNSIGKSPLVITISIFFKFIEFFIVFKKPSIIDNNKNDINIEITIEKTVKNVRSFLYFKLLFANFKLNINIFSFFI